MTVSSLTFFATSTSPGAADLPRLALALARGHAGMCARLRTHFLLLRQEKVSKEKASRSQGRGAVPCAARCEGETRKLARRAQTCAPLDPLAPALLSPANGANQKTRNQTAGQGRAMARPGGARLLAVVWTSPLAGLSSAAAGGSGRALFERSEFSPTPHDASSARNRVAALTPARLSFGYFALAKQRKVPRPPGRDPARQPGQGMARKK